MIAALFLPILLLADPGGQSLSEFQVIGTHNSYHQAPGEGELAFIRLKGEREARSLAYSHPPLAEQLASGIRQFELDCFADPKGGRFANPGVFALAKAKGGVQPEPIDDPEGLLKMPGTKVLHFPHFDFRTNTLTLTRGLGEIARWSAENPTHFPILVLLELKGDSSDWQHDSLLALESEILSALPREHLLTPDDVRGRHENLRDAILEDGWPTLDSCRGKIFLALDNTGPVRDSYLKPDPRLVGRLLFPSCPGSDHPSAAWFKLNDPVAEFDRIRKLSGLGFLVRTRADAGTWEARANDTTRRDKAFASGAQFISTDFPKANPAFSDYSVTLSDGAKEFHLKAD